MITRKRTLTRRCAICGRVYYGFGHIAEPVALGRCCDRCHAEAVLPERRRALRVVENELTDGALYRHTNSRRN